VAQTAEIHRYSSIGSFRPLSHRSRREYHRCDGRNQHREGSQHVHPELQQPDLHNHSKGIPNLLLFVSSQLPHIHLNQNDPLRLQETGGKTEDKETQQTPKKKTKQETEMEKAINEGLARISRRKRHSWEQKEDKSAPQRSF